MIIRDYLEIIKNLDKKHRVAKMYGFFIKLYGLYGFFFKLYGFLSWKYTVFLFSLISANFS